MRRQYVIAAAGAFALFAVFFLFLIRPTTSKISSTRAEVESARSEGQSLRLQLQTLKAAQKDAPAIQARLARFNVLLPAEPDLPTLIRQLQTASDSSGIELNSIAPSPPAALAGSPGISSMQIVLQIRGGYFRLESFLARLELLQRVVEVQNLSISPSRDSQTGLLTLASTVTMRTYIVAPGGAAGTGTTTRPSPTPTPRAS
jgi:type IV pilus assembly protein PilO